MFDRFYRTDPSRKRDGQGAGLGLTIARSVMEVNAGHIRVESNEQTTTFTVILPLNH
ncbi:ATP-binding protein [Paraglaciecola sp. Hal342]